MPFSREEADKAVRFFTKIPHTKAEWAGLPFELAPWQEHEIIRPLFGTLRKDGTRQYRTALIGIGRKNGKSTLSAGIALKLLLADKEPGAEVYSAAADRDQAAIVFEMAKAMVEASPNLARVTKLYRRVIEVPRTGSVYKVLSADAYTKHGSSPHGVIFDELHAQPNRELYDVLTTGQGARRQPLTVAITTAGNDPTSICFELYDYGRRLKLGTIEDPSFFFRWWGAEYEDDWTDEAVWAKANPNLGVSPTLDFLRTEIHKAQASPARQNTVRQLYLNQWVRQTTRWLDMRLWDENAGLIAEEDLAEKDCYAGLDLASTLDFSAWVLFFPDAVDVGDGETADAVLARFFLPQSALERRSAMRPTLEAWARDGWLTITPGDVLDYNAVRHQIDLDAQAFSILGVGYDSWNANEVVSFMDQNGLDTKGITQTTARLNAACRDLERRLGLRRLHHGGNPILRWMADNVEATMDSNGNLKPDRKKSTEKIDGISALVDALSMVEADSASFAVAGW